jgi:crotonobetainyl-CoA:carnitine CoA-transferase CaiB-like acyl-CoA transferase
MLGVEIMRHGPRMLRACEFGKMFWVSKLPAVLTQVLPVAGTASKFSALMEILNEDFRVAFASKTLKEWLPILAQHDVWWCMVNTPIEARKSAQCAEVGVFHDVGNGETHVAYPIHMYGQHTLTTHTAPTIGQHNSLYL